MELAIILSTVDDIYHTQKNEFNEFEVDKLFNYQQDILKLAYQHKLNKKTSIGVALSHFRTQTLNFSGSGSNIDLGIWKKFKKSSGSLSIKNAIPYSNINYSNGSSEHLAYQVIGGINVPYKSILAYAQVKHIQNQNYLFKSVGISIPVIQNFFEFHLGGKEFYNANNNYKQKLTVGTTISAKHASIQYAYETSEHIENLNSHHLSISLRY